MVIKILSEHNRIEEKRKMSRPKGSPNKSKSVRELLDLIESTAKNEGKKFAYTMEDIDEQTKTPSPFVDFMMGDDEEEGEEFVCGECHAIFDSPLKHCPECGIELRWG